MKGKTLPRVERMDRDTTGTGDAITRLYNDWTAGKIRILIGTQMITKGWDVTQVGVVGIMSAATILHLPDFRSSERTFQVLTQVAGRAGRGSDPGSVILQTYTPDNFAIQTAKFHDYESFYRTEIENRRKYSYPPFSKLVKLTFENSDEEKARKRAADTAHRSEE